ncbi:MAG TPA: hypothetical protein VN326_20200 [Casimicrobiaceae bacterium]|jgi:hypothetical protein|nr:hypothetical protein [Casimicrobiaceae bacterium]
MVSFWWVLAAFIGGGCAGVLVMALMCFAGGLPEQTDVRGTAVAFNVTRRNGNVLASVDDDNR